MTNEAEPVGHSCKECGELLCRGDDHWHCIQCGGTAVGRIWVFGNPMPSWVQPGPPPGPWQKKVLEDGRKLEWGGEFRLPTVGEWYTYGYVCSPCFAWIARSDHKAPERPRYILRPVAKQPEPVYCECCRKSIDNDEDKWVAAKGGFLCGGCYKHQEAALLDSVSGNLAAGISAAFTALFCGNSDIATTIDSGTDAARKDTDMDIDMDATAVRAAVAEARDEWAKAGSQLQEGKGELAPAEKFTITPFTDKPKCEACGGRTFGNYDAIIDDHAQRHIRTYCAKCQAELRMAYRTDTMAAPAGHGAKEGHSFAGKVLGFAWRHALAPVLGRAVKWSALGAGGLYVLYKLGVVSDPMALVWHVARAVVS